LHLFVTLVAGVRDGGEELFVAGESADIFGRAAASRGDENEIDCGGIGSRKRSNLTTCSQLSLKSEM
jgi:hypothetical protein